MQRRSLAEILTGAVVLLVAIGFLIYAVGNSGRSLAGGPGQLTLTAKFDRIDGLQPGADVRIGGVKIGSVVDQRIDPTTFLAVLKLSVDNTLKLPSDSSAEITSESLLGGKYVALVPGGSDTTLKDGGDISITQSAVSLESLLGRFIFSVTELAASKDDSGTAEGAAGTASTPRSGNGTTPRAPAP
jgi:phospholipid/cholesterol/gamma-HCH transport system substrate-binding protein